MKSDQWIVVTTIQAPTESIAALSRLAGAGWLVVVVGDTKTPTDWSADGIRYLSVIEQHRIFGAISERIPVRHYSRKNLGYLYAIQHGAKLILETDDDNIAGPDFGGALLPAVTGAPLSHPGWVNIYKYFSDELIWPRGLPLTEIGSAPPLGAAETATCPIQSYLADDDPDVDAIYRLLYKRPTRFARRPPVILNAGTWCPFNSQNTVFFEPAFPLLYLPCFVSIRMTDIWRSFVAQAALWKQGYKLSFHGPTVKQVRNDHNLMRDFADEIPGYLENDRIAATLLRALDEIGPGDLAAITRHLWRSLIEIGVVPEKDLAVIDLWLECLRGVPA
ncbi:MAG: STELLO glycosyltransferase family protein [Terriglobales bacterium]